MPPTPLRVLIAPDKFKGTLTATDAAAAIASGWRKARPTDQLVPWPISDGGEGFGSLLGEALHARPRTVRTVDAAGQPLRAVWWWDAKTRTAIIESARVIGLALLPRGQFHPFNLDTRGLAAVFAAANKIGARRCIVGIGGSATNDGGFGVAQSLGWQFLDARGAAIERWTELHRLARVIPPKRQLFRELIVAVDVQNPLLGAHGCSRVYGPQKGLRPEDLPHAERCLRRLARVLKSQQGQDAARLPGAGAAGGLGFGLHQFAGATLRPGFDLFAKTTNLLEALLDCDVVVTGEGAMDRQTVMGKGVGELARMAAKHGRPCLALAGRIEDAQRLRPHFAHQHALTELGTVAQAQKHAASWLEKLAAVLAAEITEGSALTSTRATSPRRGAARPRRTRRS